MLTPLTEDDPVAIGPYRLANRIGEGGMGTVYLAFTEQRQPVAVKVASLELSEDGEFRRRFQREVRAAQRVRAGAVAAVLDADTGSERPWMVTEYVEGISLAEAVRQRGPLAERLVRGLAAGLADALVAIHEAGVVHRDLKPSNILLAWDGPKVIDFGIAQLDGAATLTRRGHVVGTLAWMAPEQMRGDQAGPAADIFSWGCCVAYAATGRHPFHADRAEALAFRIQRDPPDIDYLPGYLHDSVVPALDKDPRLRPSAATLLADLSGHPVRSMSEAHRATETVLEREWTGPLPGRLGERSYGAPARPALPPAPPLPESPSDRLSRSGRSAAAEAARRMARADALGVPPPAETFVPSPPGGRPSPYPRSQGTSAGPGTGQQPRRAHHGQPPDRSPAQGPLAERPPAEQPLARRAPTERPRDEVTPTGPAAPLSWSETPPGPPEPAGQRTPPATITGSDGGPDAGDDRARPPAPRPRAGRADRSHRPAAPGWNVSAVLSAVLAVLWLFGIGSALGLYLGYHSRSATDAGPRRGDQLAAVGVVLGWLGVVAAMVFLGFAASRG